MKQPEPQSVAEWTPSHLIPLLTQTGEIRVVGETKKGGEVR